MTETASLLSLFLGSFFAATLLPGGSEAVLFGVLKSYPEMLWPALLIATAGNTLGGMVSFGMGWLLPLRMGGSETAGHPSAYSLRVQTRQIKHAEKVRPLPQTAGFASNVSRVRRYGAPALLLAWVPLIGDVLCVAAGWLRLSPWHAALFMAIGKFARYWVVAVAIV